MAQRPIKMSEYQFSSNQQTNYNFSKTSGLNPMAVSRTSSDRQNEDQSSLMYGADFAQIRKSIELISRVFPEIFSNEIIDKLYLALFRKFSKSQPQPARFQSQTDAGGSISEENLVKTEYEQESEYQAKRKTTDNFPSYKIKKPNSQIYFSDEEPLQSKSQAPARSSSNSSKALKKPSQKEKSLGKKSLKEIWNQDLQRQFIDLFRARKSFVQIRNYFIDKYPRYKPYFQYYQLRSQSYKIMRIALRQLYSYIRNHGNGGLPEIEKTTQTRSNCMYYHKEGYEIRLLLVELYLMKKYDQRFCSHLIKAINAFFRKVDPECNEESTRKLRRLQNQAAKHQFDASQTQINGSNFPNTEEIYDFGQNYQ